MSAHPDLDFRRRLARMQPNEPRDPAMIDLRGHHFSADGANSTMEGQIVYLRARNHKDSTWWVSKSFI